MSPRVNWLRRDRSVTNLHCSSHLLAGESSENRRGDYKPAGLSSSSLLYSRYDGRADMCGIFGVVARGASVSPGVLERATHSLAHRGPDDAGTAIIECDSDGGCQLGFAHTRLSILDLSVLGRQPIRDHATGNWIVFNGEIYNFRKLRDDLERSGAEFGSQYDTVTLLAA